MGYGDGCRIPMEETPTVTHDEFTRMLPGFTLRQAMAEAERCLLCHDAPCSRGCPCGTDPARFIRQLRFRNVRGAIRTIRGNNPLGGACGVLCPAARLCERDCATTTISSPIRIGKIQRALIEQAWETGFRPAGRAPARAGRVAVVGSGPAGLSCAAEVAKAGFPVVVFEQREKAGGVIRYGVPARRFDEQFLERELDDIRALGIEFRCSYPVRGPRSILGLLEDGFDAVFVAHGLWQAASVQPQAGTLQGLHSSIDFLSSARTEPVDALRAAVGRRRVAVVGGGDVALDCALSALRLGARDVYLVYRRSWAQMPATEEERVEAERAGVQFLLLNQPVEYLAGKGRSLRGIRLVRTRLSDPDSSGRRRPEEIPGSQWVLEIDLAIEAVGNVAEAEAGEWYPGVRRVAGRIVVDPKTGQTSIPGIFSGGDAVRGPSLVVEAVQDGKVAARGIVRLLEEKEAARAAAGR